MVNSKSSYLAEVIIMFAGAGFFLSASIRYQYIYQVVSEAHNFTSNKSFDYCSADGNVSSAEKKTVADESSRWQLYMTLASSLPAILSSLFLTSWSDKVGRKIALFFPLFGYALSNMMQLFVIKSGSPLYTLVISNAVVGLTGSFTAMLNIGMAYISDVTTKEGKLKRYAYLECGMALGGGLVSFGCGYWITGDGFLPSSWLAAGFSCAAALLVPFLPSPKSVNIRKSCENANENSEAAVPGTNQHEDRGSCEKGIGPQSSSSFVPRMKVMWKVYTSEKGTCYICNPDDEECIRFQCPHGSLALRGRVWRIILYLIAFNIFLYPIMGLAVTDTMYFVSYPLCFSPEAMGIRTAIVYGSFALGPPVIVFCKSVLKWQNGTLIIVAVVTSIAVNIALALVTTAQMVYIVSALTVISRLGPPVFRAQISSLASSSEQGAALGLISGTETSTNVIGNVTYLLIYPATLHVIRGFVYLYSAGVLVISFVLVMFAWIADKRRDKLLATSSYALLTPS